VKLRKLARLAAIRLLPILALTQGLAAPESGTRLSFRVLSALPERPPPFAAVDLVYGPRESGNNGGRKSNLKGQWWQLEIRTNAEPGRVPQCIVRGLTSADPLANRERMAFWRYQLRTPATGEALEYVDGHSGRALLPPWVDFEKYFLPAPADATRRQESAPKTCKLLGQVLSLYHVSRDSAWTPWSDVKRLLLDREMLVGTGRNFRDVEGKRLPQTPQPRNYTYTNFTGDDYRTVIEAGMNLFTIAPEQERWVRAEPVFYLRSAPGNPPLVYPADLYRANYLGPSMFVDEPASILTWDKYALEVMTHLSDAAVLIETRTRATFESERRHYGRYWIEEQLRGMGVILGDLRLGQTELPVWETFHDSAFYEMKGGGSGIVDEGRYQLKAFDEMAARFTGEKRSHTAREMLRYYYAFLRGGTRPFGKSWGTAVYGQCDPAIAPQAFVTAYEMGARYFWFWTSDHGHHVPWPEQLVLARELKDYAHAHPRASIYLPKPRTDTLILLPHDSFANYAEPGRFKCLDKNGKSPESLAHHRLMQRMLGAVQECFRKGEEFDIAVDDGRPFKGYRRVVKVSDKE
jgi:hypothetical protein